MAVIGARPATGPWFLPGRRVTPRPRRRPQSARRTRRVPMTARMPARVDVRPFVVTIVVAAALALFYLSQSTRVAATGYEIDALQARLAEVRAQQQQLILAIGQARSPAEITERAQSDLRLVPLEEGAVTFAPSASQPAD